MLYAPISTFVVVQVALRNEILRLNVHSFSLERNTKLLMSGYTYLGNVNLCR